MKKKYTFLLLLVLIEFSYCQCFTSLKAGYNHVLGQKSDGTLWVWGWGNWGQLANSTGFDEYSPLPLSNNSNWQYFSANKFNTFAVKSDGTLWGCGGNLYGSLGVGNNTTQGYFDLMQIGTAINWKYVVSSGSQTIAMKTDNTIWGWGQNDYYQVGNGSCCNDIVNPVLVSNATDWKMIAVSDVSSSFALKNNGTLWCWGQNIAGLLGDNLLSVRTVPTQHNPDTDWKFISVGTSHILALKNNNTLWAWGDGGSGETGDNYPANYNRFVPTQIGTSNNWKTVAAGFRISFGIKTDGTLWAWGLNDVGQLGDGTTTNQLHPIQIGSDTNWDSVSAGYQHVVALKTSGAVFTWGNNDFGQLGNGTNTMNTTPTAITVVGCTLSTEDFTITVKELKISPNPVHNEVNLSYSGTAVINTIVIYDASGRNVYESQPVASTNLSAIFSLSGLESGCYIIALKNNEKIVASRQLIKN